MAERKCANRKCCCICLWVCLIILGAILIPLAIGLTKGFSSENQLEQSDDSFDSGMGYPVWSDDGTAIAGVDRYWGNGLIFPPLQGWTGHVNPRFVVFVQEEEDIANNEDEDQERTNVMQVKQHALSLYYMKTAGYILINYLIQPMESRASLLVPIDEDNQVGRSTTNRYFSNDGLGYNRGPYTAIPSRDGSTIATISWETDYTTSSEVDYFAYTIDFRIAFVDVDTMESTTPKPISIPGAVIGLYTYNITSTFTTTRQYPFYYWDGDASVFRMTDLKNFSVAVHTDGTIEEDTEIPDCVPFPTASGPIRASDGARLQVDEESETITIVQHTDQQEDALQDYYCGFGATTTSNTDEA